MDERKSILIVDDDESICVTLALIFGKKGYEARTARTGREAIEEAQGRFFNLALLDIKLPDVDGLELLAPLKELHPDMVLIMATAHASLETALRALNEGASGYVTKPLNMDEVLPTIREALDKQHLIVENRRLYEAAKREVAERRRAEEALRRASREKAAILESMSELVVYLDTTHKVLWGNRVAAESVDLSPEQLVGKLCYEVWHQLSEPCVGCPIAEARKTGKAEQAEMSTPDGRVWFVRGYPILNENGEVVAAVEVTLEITERVRAEEEIRRLNQYLQSIIDDANVWVDVLDEKANVVIWNRAAEEISGYSREEVVGHQGIWKWLYPDEVYRDEITAKAAAIIEKGEEVEDFETTIRRKDGHVRVISWNSRNLLDEKGSPTGSIALGRDITERKRAEEMQSVVFEISQVASTSESLEELLQAVHAQLGRLINTTNFYVALYDEESDLYSFPYYVDEHDPYDTVSAQELPGSLTDYVRRSGKPYLIDAKLHEELIGKGELKMVGTPSPIWLGAPLKTSRGVIGVVAVQSYTDPLAYSPHDLELMAFVSENIASVIERKRAQDDLRQLKDFNEGIVQAVAEALLIEDAEGIITFVNPAMERLVGYTASELVGCHWRVTVSEGQEDAVRTRMSQRPQGAIDQYETLLRSKDGRAIPVLVSARPLYENGTYTGCLSAFTDISERVLAEKALERRTEELSLLYEAGRRLGRTLDLEVVYDTMYDLISRKMDCTGLYVSSYDPQEQMFHCTCARHNGERLDVSQLPPIPLAPEGHGNQSRVIRTGEPLLIRDYETRLRSAKTSYWVDADGSVHEEIPDDADRTRSAVMVPLKDEDRATGVLQVMSCALDAYTEDDLRFLEALALQVAAASRNALLYQQAQNEIAERKRAEDALRDSEETTRALLDATTDAAAVLVDLEGVILALNQTAAERFLKRVDDPIDARMYDLYPSDLAKVIELHVNETIRSGKASGFVDERGGRVFDNRIFPILDSRGEVVRVAVFGYDITEKRRMEEELLKAEKLKSVGVLAGGIAHDFNNVLTAIVGNIGLAKMCATPGDSVYDMLVDAERVSLQARELTRQLLTFSRGGAPIKETTSIGELVRDSATFVLSGSNVRCKFSLPEDLRAVEADTGQISQVVQNLVINADQAMPEGGIVQIRAENVTVTPDHVLPLEPGKYVKISVADEGTGISEAHLQRVFEPYFTTKQEGSGLGLATAYSIIQKHDGHLAVESELGVGTTFYVYLPASEEEAPPRRRAAEDRLAGEGRVLVMDDEEMVRKVVASMLTRMGYEVESAGDGAEAIELYRQARELGEPFDAVIMDLTIPGGMGGKEAIQELLKIDPDAKAIVSSGYSTDPVMAEFRKYGFSGVVAKPYRIRQLAETLREVIAGAQG